MIALHLSRKRFYAIFFYVSVLYFNVWIIWPELRIYSQGVWVFNKFENIIHKRRWWDNFHFESLSHKFADFDILQILNLNLFLGQNSFEWKAFC